MIVLPNTPPVPVQIEGSTTALPAQVLSLRTSLQNVKLATYNDSINYVVNLEKYLDSIDQISDGVDASETFVSSNIPWNHLSKTKFKQFFNTGNKKIESVRWSLMNELIMTSLSISLIYVRIASDLLNSTIDTDVEPPAKAEEYNESWKQVMNLYKKSISFLMYEQSLESKQGSFSEGALKINPVLIPFLSKISEICIQVSILAKYLWINRASINYNEQVTTENNATLAKVAIFCVNELEASQKLLESLLHSTGKKTEADNELINLDYRDWEDYLSLFKRYISAYAGLFLAIQNYRDDKIGNALGLIRYSLLALQSKKDLPPSSTLHKKFSFQKIRNKVQQRSQENVLQSLNSISTLDIKRSAFNDKSGIVLNDLAYLYDQLIRLNLKFTSENDNLKYQDVVHWSSVGSDSKWPIGCKIPVSNIEPYEVHKSVEKSENEYAGRGSYF
ncbi:uncharacterized protein LODBEIA_P50610 [Lodderomyces beijingensis]|uniref:PH-response regulator protein palC n=1 Tax=Lodderomyces beijingensis TaxID=1775926 RepID=A0ABP0ZTZ6_9ASCO